ncbi:MAG: C39 family peptidase [Chlamydiota bacterium]|nr:C39 family peptidase [Chlamydiota bacterium]
MDTTLDFNMLPQPNDATCGPTCLHAVYHYYHDLILIDQVISEVTMLEEGGTVAVYLANHALQRGYRATIYTYNLQIFDPTWFKKSVNISERLIAQIQHKDIPKLHTVSKAYLDFFNLGGKLLYEDLKASLIRTYLYQGKPILSGLSATYLHRSSRENANDSKEDDIRGEPAGHFVVLCGYDKATRSVIVADPLQPNPISSKQQYITTIDRVIGAILLGIITYDANLLIIEPKRK